MAKVLLQTNLTGKSILYKGRAVKFGDEIPDYDTVNIEPNASVFIGSKCYWGGTGGKTVPVTGSIWSPIDSFNIQVYPNDVDFVTLYTNDKAGEILELRFEYEPYKFTTFRIRISSPYYGGGFMVKIPKCTRIKFGYGALYSSVQIVGDYLYYERINDFNTGFYIVPTGDIKLVNSND